MSSKTAHSTSTFFANFDKTNLDSLTRATMLELMKTAKFKELWMNMAMEIEERNETKQSHWQRSIEDELKLMEIEVHPRSPTRLNSSKIGEYIQQKAAPPANPFLNKSFRELTQGLMLAIETFIRGTQMAISCSSPVVRTFNRDAAQLYSVRIQLDRFVGCSTFRTAQFGLIVRGFQKMLKLFTTYISSPYFIENAHFFANALLEMLAQFLEYTSLFDEIDRCIDAHLFCQKIEDFENLVCQPLDGMLLKKQRRASSFGRSSTGPSTYLSKSLQCMDLAVKGDRVILLPLHHGTSPPVEGNRSFLMAPELENDRRKMFNSPNFPRRLKSIMLEDRRIGQKTPHFACTSLSGKERTEFRNACKMAREAIEAVSRHVQR